MNKFFIFLFAAVAFIVTCKNVSDKTVQVQNQNTLQKDKEKGKKYPEMQFDTMQWYFGSIKEGEIAEHDFHFKNVGDGVLIINDVKPSCGCTSPEWPKEPIAPGEEGVIKVKFNSKNHVGKNDKSVTIQSNPCTVKGTNKISNETYLGIHVEVH